MSEIKDSSKEHWHLDKRVPLTLIVTLIIQTVVITAYGASQFSSIDSRISSLEKSDKSQESHERRLTVLEEKFSFIRDDLGEIKDLLRRGLPKEKSP